MSSSFSDKSWSGTPMWQIAQELEAQREEREAKEAKKASTPVAVLNVRVEGETNLCELMLLIPSKADVASGGFREVKVRGPKRKTRPEAMKDGFELRASFHEGVAQGGGDEGEMQVLNRVQALKARTWRSEELPGDEVRIEEEADQEHRLRLASRPRGTGWTRQKDKEFFVHSHSPMAYAPKKMQYFTVDAATQQYTPCEPPHDPTEHAISVSAGASLVGRSDADLGLPERPRSLLLKELVKTGAAMKKPLFFLDQPAACFAVFEGLRGSAAVEWCSKQFHTKLLSRLSKFLQYWSEALVENLLKSIFEELDAELLQQGATCYDGVSIGVVLLLGDRLTVATLGEVRGLWMPPSGEARIFGDQHRVSEEGQERQRVDAAFGEVVQSGPEGARSLSVRRPLQSRETTVAQEQAAEIHRVLECSPDSFATLGFSSDDTVDGKAARSQYKKLALRVHPDKALPNLKERAKEAFAKVEAAAEAIESLAAADMKETTALHRLLCTAGSTTSAVMPRAWALGLLGLSEGATLEEAETAVEELRKKLRKLGQFENGRLAHADARRADRFLEDALEVLAAPVPKDGCNLEAVKVTRALGLRDLKKPRPVVTAVPQVDVVSLEGGGPHHLALLSSSMAALSHEEIRERVRTFPRQPKAASLVLAQDAANRGKERGAAGPACLASSVVAVFEVCDAAQAKREDPPAKKARTSENPDKIRGLHILLKHKDLKMTKDMESQLRLKGKGPVTRTVAQAERELLEMQKALAANPNIFHVFARKHSECDTALQPGQSAGDLGWVSRGSYGGSPFEAALFALKVYEVSDIITTPRGLHIIQRIA